MHPGLRPAFLSHQHQHQPYQLPYQNHNVQQINQFLPLQAQGMIQSPSAFNPLHQQHQVQVPVEPHHPLICMTNDAKPRLRWTSELHARFVDAVYQLGGASKATPKTIMDIMKIRGLTLYQLKSHLQKFRLGKCGLRKPPKDGHRKRAKSAKAPPLGPGIRKRAKSAKTLPLGPGSSSVPVPSHINDALLPLVITQHSSIDSYASHEYTLFSDWFPELVGVGGEGLRDSEEDPALTYLNLDVGDFE